jgi:hypothetical protein
MNKEFLLAAAVAISISAWGASVFLKPAATSHTSQSSATQTPLMNSSTAAPEPQILPIPPGIVLSEKTTRLPLSLSISSPSAGQQFATGAAVEHRAHAIDPIEGDISHRVEWRDTSSGRLLSKGAVFKFMRTQGQHAVTASVVGTGKKSVSSSTVYMVNKNQNASSSTADPAPDQTSYQATEINSPKNLLSNNAANINQEQINTPASTQAVNDLNAQRTWIPYGFYSGSNTDTEVATSAAASDTASATTENTQKTKLKTPKTQEKPSEPAPVAEDIEQNMKLCGEPIKIDLRSLVTSTSSEINWSTLEWKTKEQNPFKIAQDPKNQAIISIDYIGKSINSDQISFHVADQQGRYSNFSNIRLNILGAEALVLEGFEKPVVPKDNTGTHKWGLIYASQRSDASLFSDSSWTFHTDAGAAGSAIAWRAGETDSLNPPESNQAALIHHGGIAQISNTIKLKKGEKYQISFYAARSLWFGHLDRAIQIKVNKKSVGNVIKINPPRHRTVTFDKYFTSDFVSQSDGNQDLDVFSVKDTTDDAQEIMSYIDAICVFPVDKK